MNILLTIRVLDCFQEVSPFNSRKSSPTTAGNNCSLRMIIIRMKERKNHPTVVVVHLDFSSGFLQWLLLFLDTFPLETPTSQHHQFRCIACHERRHNNFHFFNDIAYPFLWFFCHEMLFCLSFLLCFSCKHTLAMMIVMTHTLWEGHSKKTLQSKKGKSNHFLSRIQ